MDDKTMTTTTTGKGKNGKGKTRKLSTIETRNFLTETDNLLEDILSTDGIDLSNDDMTLDDITDEQNDETTTEPTTDTKTETPILTSKTDEPKDERGRTIIDGMTPEQIRDTNLPRYKQLISSYKRKLHNGIRLGFIIQEPKGLTDETITRINKEYQLTPGMEWKPGTKFLPPDQQDI
jgi:hypothetical protein